MPGLFNDGDVGRSRTFAYGKFRDEEIRGLQDRFILIGSHNHSRIDHAVHLINFVRHDHQGDGTGRAALPFSPDIAPAVF